MKPIKLKWIKMSTLLCCTVLFILCGFRSPAIKSVPTYAKTLSSPDSVLPPASSETGSSSSAASSAASSAVSSQSAEDQKPVAKVALPVVKTQPKVETAAQESQDPEKDKVKPKPPAPSQPAGSVTPSSTAPSSTAVSSSKPASSTPASSTAASSAAPSSAASSSSAPVFLNGWRNENGNLVYYRNNVLLKGWDTLDGTYYGKKYYFNEATGAVKTRLGVDVSRYQGTIDWNAVKADGVDFVNIRIGGRTYGSAELFTDTKFEQNYRGAVAAGIKVGVYFYSQAITVQEAQEEASYVLNILNGRKLDLPVSFDTEQQDGARADALSQQGRTNMCITFCEMIKANGYTPMVYAGLGWTRNGLFMDQLSSYKTWIAHYVYDATDSSGYNNPYQYWQYIDCGGINGISTGVDMDVTFD